MEDSKCPPLSPRVATWPLNMCAHDVSPRVQMFADQTPATTAARAEQNPLEGSPALVPILT